MKRDFKTDPFCEIFQGMSYSKIGAKKQSITAKPMEGFKCSGGDVEVIPLEFWQVEKILQKQFTVDRIS